MYKRKQQLYVIARFSDGPRLLAQTPSSVWASDLGPSEDQATISYCMNFFKKKERSRNILDRFYNNKLYYQIEKRKKS